ncbi:hypothetical protein OKW45_005966 [Paraburkholderia sp. WSM4175]
MLELIRSSLSLPQGEESVVGNFLYKNNAYRRMTLTFGPSQSERRATTRQRPRSGAPARNVKPREFPERAPLPPLQ